MLSIDCHPTLSAHPHITNTTIIASTQTMNQRDSENDNVVQSNTRPAAETISIRKQCSGVTLNLKLLSHPFIDLTLSTESITEEKGGLAEPPAGRTNVQVGQSNSIRRSTSNANEDIPNKTRVAERDEWHFIALYLSQIVSDCVRHALQILFLIIIMAVMISIRIVWRILLTCVEVHLQSWQIEEPNKEVGPKNCADITVLRAKEDNELAECDSDESEECQKGQTQDVLNSIDVTETRAEDTIPQLIEAYTESEECEDSLPEYQNLEEEPIEEADSWGSVPSISDDSMERQSISPYCESPDCVCHVFERYYLDCDSEQTSDYKVSELPSETPEEDYKVGDYYQCNPDSYSLRFFNDDFPHIPYKVLVNQSDSLDEQEGQECPIQEWSDSDSDYVDDMTFDEREDQAEKQHKYIPEADSGSGGLLRPAYHDWSELMDIDQNFEEQKDSDKERLHHQMSALLRRIRRIRRHVLDISSGLEEVQPQESFNKYI